jgi:arylsulfatase A
MKKQTIFLLLFLVIVFSCTKKQEQQKENGKPNIVIILADDMGYGDPGCYNSESKIPTPNIDGLAEAGIMLTDAHSPHAWCTPSRYGLLTGRYPARTELNWRERSVIGTNVLTLPEMLKQEGYHTGMVGKWHLGFDNLDPDSVDCDQNLTGGPVDRGFDYFFGIHASLDIPPYFYIENNRCVAPPSDYVDDHQSENATTRVSGAFWRAGNMAPGFKHEDVLPDFTEKAVEFIAKHANDKPEQPLFLYLALTAPHTPWLPGQEFEGKSNAGEYGDFTNQVDYTVGEVLNALKAAEIEDETLVVFTSDNGPVWFPADLKKFDHRSVKNLKGMKIDLWEGGHRVPFVARWPGKIKPGTVRNDLFCFIDIMATIASVTGTDLPENAGPDSYNMLPVFLDEQLDEPVRKELLIADKVLRQNNWKYIEGSGWGDLSKRFRQETPAMGMPGGLYNLGEDISEQNNRYNDDPDRVEQMQVRLKQILEFE